MLDRPVKGFPLPAVVDPPKICIQFEIPNEQTHIANFLGNFLNLAYWFSYQRDDAHTGLAVSKVWYQVYQSVVQAIIDGGGCEIAPAQFVEWEDSFMPAWRESCVNGKYKLEVRVCACPEEWVTVSILGGNSTQPGAGSPQPKPGGGQQTYQGCLAANNQYALPTVLNTGDVVSVSSLSGAWNDSDRDAFIYRCGDGEIFFGGACVGAAVLISTDPLPTAPHMTMLLLVGGVYYDVGNGIATIGAGVSNQQGVIICNDSVRGNDNGDICFNVTVTNNQQATFTHTFDMVLTNGGFVTVAQPTTPPFIGAWIPSVGWQGTSAVGSGGAQEHGEAISLSFASPVTLTGGSFEFNLVKGTFLPGLSNSIEFSLSGSTVVQTTLLCTSQPDGTNLSMIIPNGSYVTDKITIVMRDAYYISGSDGTSTILRTIVSGIGSDPF